MTGMTYQTRVYLHGAFASVVNGISNSVVAIMVDPQTFNLFQGGARKLTLIAAASGVFAFFTYLKDHPLPTPKDTDFEIAAQAKISAIVQTGTGDGTQPQALPNLKLE